jgi:hypothetical protein
MPAFFYVVVFLLLAACAAPSDQMTSSEAEAFKRQISTCWRLPEETRGVEGMVVQVQMLMRPDRTVQAVTITGQERFIQDPTFRAIAESARQAIEKCSPLNLPPDKYDHWREFNFELRFVTHLAPVQIRRG